MARSGTMSRPVATAGDRAAGVGRGDPALGQEPHQARAPWCVAGSPRSGKAGGCRTGVTRRVGRGQRPRDPGRALGAEPAGEHPPGVALRVVVAGATAAPRSAGPRASRRRRAPGRASRCAPCRDRRGRAARARPKKRVSSRTGKRASGSVDGRQLGVESCGRRGGCRRGAGRGRRTGIGISVSPRTSAGRVMRTGIWRVLRARRARRSRFGRRHVGGRRRCPCRPRCRSAARTGAPG